MTFVRCKSSQLADLGIGKRVGAEGELGLVEFFVSPADEPVKHRVPHDDVREIELSRQERVFFKEDGIWHVGRLDTYFGKSELSLHMPNGGLKNLHVDDAFVRSNVEMETPLSLLKARSTETPFWHEGRSGLLRSLVRQRAVYRGLTSVASSNIEILGHQLSLIRRILSDPVGRYLLADEVGLGKTIEAGIILRQVLLDEPDNSSILVIVPEHLVVQWEDELASLFHIRDDLRVKVTSHGAEQFVDDPEYPPNFLVVDEAHQIAKHAYEEARDASAYWKVSELAQKCRGVLLLSATPVIHNEDAFLAMLHLLDPVAHPLSDRDSFRQRIAHRESIAGAIRDLDDDASGFLIESALDDLRPLAATNPTLNEFIESLVLAQGDGSGGAECVEPISRLRAYLQESYRLDRRILRTRRAQGKVVYDLPRRQLTAWTVEDEWRQKIFAWIDLWRYQAADAEDRDACEMVFLELLDAAICHPLVLSRVVVARIEGLVTGLEEFFEGEEAFLREPPESLQPDHDPRIPALTELIRKGRERDRWVVFASDSAVADHIAEELNHHFRVLRLVVGDDADSTVKSFRGDKRVRAIICDESCEDGLNLQGVGAQVVHFDVPLFANRIEQRIGRLDRLQGDPTVVSLVPFNASGVNYEQAWVTCLSETVRAFEESVASLQHALDAGRRQLLTTLVDGGVEAINDLSDAWGADEGELSLSRERRLIENQDLFDEISTLDDEQEELLDAIDEYEYATDPTTGDALYGVVDAWAFRSLCFEPHTDEDGSVEYRHSRKTLLSKTRFSEAFGRSFRHERRRDGACTGWMNFDREGAADSKRPVVRVGHPFVEDLRRFLDSDDRGRAYAFWRTVPNLQIYGIEDEGGLFFRFDYYAEANLGAIDELVRSQKLARGAIARRAEEAFPPTFATVWVDAQGDIVRDPTLLVVLEQPYSHADTNLRHPLWEHVDDLGLVADWSVVCERAQEVAFSHYQETVELRQRIDSAKQVLSKKHKERVTALEARIASLDRHESERIELDVETGLFGCLLETVSNPRVRLDSVGAMVLSEQNPFSEA
jgi:ATP-dependent helicase HepA